MPENDEFFMGFFSQYVKANDPKSAIRLIDYHYKYNELPPSIAMRMAETATSLGKPDFMTTLFATLATERSQLIIRNQQQSEELEKRNRDILSNNSEAMIAIQKQHDLFSANATLLFQISELQKALNEEKEKNRNLEKLLYTIIPPEQIANIINLDTNPTSLANKKTQPFFKPANVPINVVDLASDEIIDSAVAPNSTASKNAQAVQYILKNRGIGPLGKVNKSGGPPNKKQKKPPTQKGPTKPGSGNI